MGLIDKFLGESVFADTAVFIYYFEQHLDYHPLVAPVFEACSKGELFIITSSVTLAELLVKPLQLGETELASTYSHILSHAPHINLVNIDTNVARKAAQLRAQHRLHLPDALQIASGIVNGAKYFLTNDKRLLTVKELEVVCLNN